MPTYRITDPNTGRTLRLTGDSPPTEQELSGIFQNTFNVSGLDATKVQSLVDQGYSEREITDYLSNRNKVESKEIREAKYGTISNPPEGFLATEAPAFGGAIGGSILGGKIGALTPVPGGTLMGSVLGAGIGAMAGESGRQLYRSGTGKEVDLGNIPRQGAFQAGGELLGAGLVRGAQKTIPHIAPQFMRQEIRQLGEKFGPYVNQNLPNRNVTQGFLPAQIAAPQSAAGKYQKILESTFTGSKPLREFEFAQEKGLRDLARDTADEVWQGIRKIPREKLGEQTINAIELAKQAHMGVASRLYDRVDDIAGRITVPRTKTIISNLVDQNGKPISRQITVQSNDIVDYGPLKSFLESIKMGRQTGKSEMGDAFIDKLIKDIDNIGGADTFTGAHDLRARIGAEITALEKRDPAHRIATMAKDKLSEIMDRTADAVQSPELKKAYHDANKFYKTYSERYKNDFINSLFRKASDVTEGGTPSAAVELIFKNERPEYIDAARKAIGQNTQAWKNIKAGLLEKWLVESTNADGNLLGNTFFNRLRAFGPESLVKTFGTDTAMQLKNLERIASTIQKSIPSGGGSMLAQLLQSGQIMQVAGMAGALGGGMAGQYATDDPSMMALGIGGALGVLTVPRVLSKMLVHPKYGKLFLDGFKPGITKEQSLKSITRLAAAATEYMTQEESVNKQRERIQSMPGREIKQ